MIDLYYQQPESTLLLPIRKYFDYQSFGKTAFVCVVSLPDYYDFIRDGLSLREYMFEANVRDHAPDATVNKAIHTTLAVPDNDDFWWLNNGITILASDVSYTGNALRLTDPQIVNQLQSSHEVFNHFAEAVLFRPQDNRSVMVKVIRNIDADTSDRIIRATNSQTKIESINLHASEQIHRDIETALKNVDLFYDRRKNFYLNKCASASKIITIGYMAQAITAIVLQQPNDARARPTTVADKNYKKLFSDIYPIQLYPKCAQIMKRVDLYLDEKGLTQGTKLNLVFYLGMYATSAAFKIVKPNTAKIASSRHVFDGGISFGWAICLLLETFAKLGGSDHYREVDLSGL